MHIICSDLEGVFVPEIWIGVSRKTGIDELKLTTRDISDYDLLMKRRLEILRDNNLRLSDIQYVISTLKPLPGAVEFLNWVRSKMQIIIVSDTFTEFAGPFMRQLGYPALFCHSLTTDLNGVITGYNLRQHDSKKMAAIALQSLNYKVTGIGDSYNDISMLRHSDYGILFNPPDTVKNENSDLPAVYNYQDLREEIEKVLSGVLK